MPYEDDDPFAGGSSPALSFKDAPIGTTYTGTVVKAPTLVQSRDFETGEPAFWPDNNPKMSVVVNLEVDGEERSLWAPKPSAMFAALQKAQVEAGERMSSGGKLSVKLTGTEPNKNPRLNDRKIYAAKYEPPAKSDPFANSQAPF